MLLKPQERNTVHRFIQLDKRYDGPVALPPASGPSLPRLPIRSATKRTCHAVDGRQRSCGKLVLSHEDSRQGGALAYYSVFSLGPVIVIAIAVAGFFFGRDAVTGQVASSIKNTLGDTRQNKFSQQHNPVLTCGCSAPALHLAREARLDRDPRKVMSIEQQARTGGQCASSTARRARPPSRRGGGSANAILTNA